MELCNRCKINKAEIKCDECNEKFCELCDYYVHSIINQENQKLNKSNNINNIQSTQKEKEISKNNNKDKNDNNNNTIYRDSNNKSEQKINYLTNNEFYSRPEISIDKENKNNISNNFDIEKNNIYNNNEIYSLTNRQSSNLRDDLKKNFNILINNFRC